MASLTELRAVRLEKLEKLQILGMKPFASEVKKTHNLVDIEKNFADLETSKEEVFICGRITALRGQGAIMFAQLFDGTTRFQVVIKQDIVGDDAMKNFGELVDLGDFVQFGGTCETTQKGQPSVFATSWNMLTKSLLPLPDKYHGIQDEELSIRQRYLDMATNDEVYNRFVIRSKTISYIRNYLDKKNFLEIETPILENQAGGAMARTFNTFHNDYQMPMVLRIAVELNHKIVTAGGMQRVYEFAKTFRNEGTDPTHAQEFTMLEWYAAYENLETNMKWTEEMLRGVARDVVGKTTFTVFDKEGNGVEVDFEKEWPRLRFPDLLKENANFDMFAASMEEIKQEAMKWGLDKTEAEKTGKGNLLDFIFKKSSRKNIIHPTFVLDYPSDLKPLAQQNGDGTATVCQLIIGGAEITNQYLELVDPLVERQLLEEQASAKAGGDEEAMEVDERFLTAMEHGMPPMTGFGMGIDRLVGILTDQKNIRDVILFPILKPDEEKKKDELKIAVVVLNKGANLEKWQELNSVGHLAAAFGAHKNERDVFYKNSVTTKDNQEIALNIKHAIMIKTADSSEHLHQLVKQAKSSGLEISEFTREMLETTNDKKVLEITSGKNMNEVEHLGVLIFGDKKVVDQMTKSLEFYK